MRKQPWLYSPGADSVFILAPAFLVTAVVLSFPALFAGPVTPVAWFLLVVGVDVAAVRDVDDLRLKLSGRYYPGRG